MKTLIYIFIFVILFLILWDLSFSILFHRSSLMFQIIRKMQYDVHPPTQSKTKVLSMSHRYYDAL